MSRVFNTSDLHFSHENMIKKYRGFDSIEEHDEMIIHNWNSSINKRDKVFLHGDISMEKDVSHLLKRLNGNIVIIGGNHEKPSILKRYLELPGVIGITGIIKYKGYWLTHAPVHPMELRGFKNIHGHIHKNLITLENGDVDERYINVCVDHTDYKPVLFNDIKARYDKI